MLSGPSTSGAGAGAGDEGDANDVTILEVYDLIRSLQTEVRDLRTQVDRVRGLQVDAAASLDRIKENTQSKTAPLPDEPDAPFSLFRGASKGKGRDTTPTATLLQRLTHPVKGKPSLKSRMNMTESPRERKPNNGCPK